MGFQGQIKNRIKEQKNQIENTPNSFQCTCVNEIIYFLEIAVVKDQSYLEEWEA